MWVLAFEFAFGPTLNVRTKFNLVIWGSRSEVKSSKLKTEEFDPGSD